MEPLIDEERFQALLQALEYVRLCAEYPIDDHAEDWAILNVRQRAVADVLPLLDLIVEEITRLRRRPISGLVI